MGYVVVLGAVIGWVSGWFMYKYWYKQSIADKQRIVNIYGDWNASLRMDYTILENKFTTVVNENNKLRKKGERKMEKK